jgi:hypothetical protein
MDAIPAPADFFQQSIVEEYTAVGETGIPFNIKRAAGIVVHVTA